MPLKQKDLKELISDQLWPAFKAEKDRLDRIDKWWRWDHEKPHQPKHSTKEYKELSARSQSPWLSLVVTAVAQALYVEGYRQKEASENAKPWYWWQANGMDGRQIALHRSALAYGHAYETILPGEDAFGNKMPVMRGVSPRRMITFYREPENDDYPMFALRADPAKVNGSKGWALKLYDDESVYYLNADSMGSGLTYIETRGHGLGLCPVVRFANQLDLEGRTPGEIEPLIPIAGRIDQTTFDRLVVQRFASWKVRYITGMAKPDSEEEAAAEKMRLKVEDILITEDHDAKVGTLEETQLEGFIKAAEADIKVLAAVSQTPAHELLGTIANVNAEAVVAARAGHGAKIEERKHALGEPHEQSFRTAAHVMGESEAAQDVEAQVKWADKEIRSLAQAADAIGKLSKMAGVPVEMLWEMIPGFTQTDVERAKALVKTGDSFTALIELLDKQANDAVPAS